MAMGNLGNGGFNWKSSIHGGFSIATFDYRRLTVDMSPFLRGKSSNSGPCSLAMLNCGRMVTLMVWRYLKFIFEGCIPDRGWRIIPLGNWLITHKGGITPRFGTAKPGFLTTYTPWDDAPYIAPRRSIISGSLLWYFHCFSICDDY